MDIIIYEDQTGLMLFPNKTKDKDTQIVSFFNNNIDLYIEKAGGNVTIYCHLMAFEAASRPLGYYVIYKNVYSDNVFSNFKVDVNNILNTLKIQPRIGHNDNVIFESIERFDDNYQYYQEDIDAVREAINYRSLEYSSGNTKDISAFCRDILKTTKNIKISVSSTRCELGNVNILLNKKQSDSLKRIGSTEQTISETRYRLKQNKKKEDGRPGMSKMEEGFGKIKEGVEMLRLVDYSPSEIRNDIDSKINDILGGAPKSPKYRDSSDINLEKIGVRKLETEEKSAKRYDENVEKEEEADKKHAYGEAIKTVAIIAGIVVAISLLYMYWPYISSYTGDSYQKMKSFVGYKDKTDVRTTELPKITATSNPDYKISESNSAVVGGEKTNMDNIYTGESGKLSIIKFDPPYMTTDVVGQTKRFSIVTNQIVDIYWYFNGAQVQVDKNTDNSMYTNKNATQGIWVINATMTNANGTMSREWSWMVVSNVTNKNVNN